MENSRFWEKWTYLIYNTNVYFILTWNILKAIFKSRKYIFYFWKIKIQIYSIVRSFFNQLKCLSWVIQLVRVLKKMIIIFVREYNFMSAEITKICNTGERLCRSGSRGGCKEHQYKIIFLCSFGYFQHVMIFSFLGNSFIWFSVFLLRVPFQCSTSPWRKTLDLPLAFGLVYMKVE